MIYQAVNILSTKMEGLKLQWKDYICVIIVMHTLLADAANENDKAEKNVCFKSNASFLSCISKLTVRW